MQPIKVNDVEIAFGGDMEKLLPSMEVIPDIFKKGRSEWNTVVSDWFYRGLRGSKWIPKDGVETGLALRHVKAVMASYQPKHQHKEAGCAYLLSEFFISVEYENKP